MTARSPAVLGPTKPPTRESVRRMTALGIKPRQIAAALGISTQAAYKHLAALKREAEEEAS